jgi:hypothetical protein
MHQLLHKRLQNLIPASTKRHSETNRQNLQNLRVADHIRAHAGQTTMEPMHKPQLPKERGEKKTT